MKIELVDPQNLKDQEDIDSLNRIVYSIADGWHEWAAPDPREPEMAAYFQVRPSDMELLEKSYVKAAAYPDDVPGRMVGVYVATPRTSGNDNFPAYMQLSLPDAVKYLKQPLKILVENVINDGKFLRKYLKVIDSDLVSTLDDPDSPAVFDHSGGKAEMLNHLESRLEQATRHGIPLRLIVIFDSDACYPGHSTAETKALEVACANANVTHHCLNKRSIENYIVERDLEAYAEKFPDITDAVDFFRGLSRVQKDFYPMKKGFPRSSVMHGQISLFADISAEDGAHKLSRAAEYIVNISELELETFDLEEIAALDEIEKIAKVIRMEL